MHPCKFLLYNEFNQLLYYDGFRIALNIIQGVGTSKRMLMLGNYLSINLMGYILNLNIPDS